MTEHFKINKRPKIKLLSRKYIYARLILLYTFAYTAAFVAGCLLFHMLEIKSSATIDARIFSYFSAGFRTATISMIIAAGCFLKAGPILRI